MNHVARFVAWLRLRDPMWQAIGALIAFAAMFVSIFVAYDIYQRTARPAEVTIHKDFAFSPWWWADKMKGRVTFTIDGATVPSAEGLYYVIANTGSHAVRPGDYIKPLRASVGGGWEILAVSVQASSPPGMEVGWTRITTNSFEMEPVLLNPRDSLDVTFFLYSYEKPLGNPNIEWTARIANVHTLRFADPDVSIQSLRLPFLPRFWFYLYGGEVYVFSVLGSILMLVVVLTGMRSRRLKLNGIGDVILLTSLGVLSFGTSTSLTDLMSNGRIDSAEVAIVLLYTVGLLVWLRLVPTVALRVGTSAQRAINQEDAAGPAVK